jgi:DNA-binding GntR family transcriptional regulator
MALGFDFHGYIFKHCQNERMYDCSRRLRNAIRLAQTLLGKNLGYFRQSLKEHKDLFDALKEGSRDCEKILQKHIERSCDRMRNNLSDLNLNN